MADQTPQSEMILYQTEDGRTRIQCRFENETIWLTQKLMAELFQKDVRTINEHVQNVLAEAELVADSVIRKFRITAADGKTYETQHCSLEMILAVGYRVKSPRGTQFRQWATVRLSEYLLKGFVMDDERRYSRRVEMAEIEKNDFNLNISRCISTAVGEDEIDLEATHSDLVGIEETIQKATAKHNEFLKELGLPPLP